MTATIVGTSLLQTSGAANRTITPHASSTTDDLILVVSSVGGATGTMTPPGGWTTILANTATGSLCSSIFGFKRLAGDTSYSFAIAANLFSTHLCITIRGWVGTIGSLVIGAGGARAASGGTVNTTAPTITTASADNLVLCIGTERTTTTETGITGLNNGFTEYLWVNQQSGSALETVEVAQKTIAVAGAVGATTITYPNTQASNAIAILLAIPPGVVLPTVNFAWLSSVETNAIRAGWSTTSATSVRAVVSTASDLSSPVYSGTASPAVSGWVTARVTGLTPGTLYYVGIEANGTLLSAGRLQGRTMVTGVRSFKFLTGSCQFTGSNHAVFDTMRAENADFLLHQGDIHYADTGVEATWHAAFTSSMSTVRFSALAASLPMNYCWDNHDWAGQGKSAIDWDNVVNPQAFIRELSGEYEGVTSLEIYRSWVNGRVRFIHTDQWSERSPDTDPETSAKRCMSAEQEQWLYDTLTAATEPVIVWATAWPLYTSVPGGRWGSYTTQRDRIVAWLAARPTIQARIIGIGGDSHSVSADSGANQHALGPMPTLNSSGFNQTGGLPSGTWDIVNFDTVDADGYYSRVTITDPGTSITLLWEAVDQSSTVIGTFSRTFTVPPGAGSATINNTFNPTAVGKRTPKSASTINDTFNPTAVGKETPKGSATVSNTFNPAAVGKRTPKGSAAAINDSFNPTAVGAKTPKGSAALSNTFVPAAVGLKTLSGSVAVVNNTFNPVAVGKKIPKGTGTVSVTYHVVVAGPAATGLVVTLWVWDGTQLVAPTDVFTT